MTKTTKSALYISAMEEGFRNPDTGHILFLSMLAYPSPSEVKLIANFFSAWTYEHDALMCELQKRPLTDILPRFRKIKKDKRERNYKNFWSRIEKRMLAAKIALQRINWEPSLARSVRRYLDITDSKWGKEGNKEIDPQVVINEIWTTSKPVLHYALALLPFIEQSTFFQDIPSLTLGEMRALRFIDLRDLLLHSNMIAKEYKIESPDALLTFGDWVPQILKIADVWRVILPHYTPSIK